MKGFVHRSALRGTLVALSLLFNAIPTAAQKQVQRGIARMITRTAADPIVPVAGVQVVVGNVAHKASDKNGHFSLQVQVNSEKSYTLADVRLPKGSKLILATPTKNTKLYLSRNELAVTFVSAEDRDAVSRATFKRLLKKYNAQAEHLRQLRTKLREKLLAIDENSKEYAKVKAEYDSVQNLLNIYFDEKNREETLKALSKISDELAVTDYQSLDSLQARIYELKMEGDWATISALLHDLMGGDAARWMQQKTDLKNKTEEELAQGIRLTRAALESYKEQGENDSVSHYYEILIDVDPSNYATIEEAGLFEWKQRGNLPKALTYLQNALETYASQHSEADENTTRLRSEIEKVKRATKRKED